jgi:hypothetical protein
VPCPANVLSAVDVQGSAFIVLKVAKLEFCTLLLGLTKKELLEAFDFIAIIGTVILITKIIITKYSLKLSLSLSLSLRICFFS